MSMSHITLVEQVEPDVNSFQSQVTDANTIYEICYDFDLHNLNNLNNLNNVPFQMPANSILYFNGGTITGRLAGNNTAIHAPITKIFSDQTFITGTWIVDGVYPDWFGCNHDFDVNTHSGTDDSAAFNRAVEMAENCNIGKVTLASGCYYIEHPIVINKGNIRFTGISGQLREERYQITQAPTYDSDEDFGERNILDGSVIYVKDVVDGIVIASSVCDGILIEHLNMVGLGERGTEDGLKSVAINFMSDFFGPTWPVMIRYCHFEKFRHAFFLNSRWYRYSIFKLNIEYCSFLLNDYCVYFNELQGIIRSGTVLTEEEAVYVNTILHISSYEMGSILTSEDALSLNQKIYKDFSDYTTGYSQMAWEMNFSNNCCHHNSRILKVNVQKDTLTIANNNSENCFDTFSDGSENDGYAYDIQTGQRCHVTFAGNHFEGMGCKLLKVYSCHVCEDTIDIYGNNTDGERGSDNYEAYISGMHVLRCDLPAKFDGCIVDTFKQNYALGIEGGSFIYTPFIPFGNSTTRKERFVKPDYVQGHLQFADTAFGRLPMIVSPLKDSLDEVRLKLAHYTIEDNFTQDQEYRIAFVMRTEQMKNNYLGKMLLDVKYYTSGGSQISVSGDISQIYTDNTCAKMSDRDTIFQITGTIAAVANAAKIEIDLYVYYTYTSSVPLVNPDYPSMLSLPYLTYKKKTLEDNIDHIVDFHLPYTFIPQLKKLTFKQTFNNMGITCEEGDTLIFEDSNAAWSRHYMLAVSQSGTIDSTTDPSLNGTYSCNSGDHFIATSQRLMPGVYLKIGTKKVKVMRLIGDNMNTIMNTHQAPFCYEVDERIRTTQTDAPLECYPPVFSMNPIRCEEMTSFNNSMLNMLEDGTVIVVGITAYTVQGGTLVKVCQHMN